VTAEEKMSIDEELTYLRAMNERYRHAKNNTKGELFDEMQAVTGNQPKRLIRLVNGSLKHRPRSRERGETYGPDVDDALRVIDPSSDHICAERLLSNPDWMARHLDWHGALRATTKLLNQLLGISLCNVQRRLSRIRQ